MEVNTRRYAGTFESWSVATYQNFKTPSGLCGFADPQCSYNTITKQRQATYCVVDAYSLPGPCCQNKYYQIYKRATQGHYILGEKW